MSNETETTVQPPAPLEEAEIPQKIFHNRARQGAMLANVNAAFARQFLMTASNVPFLLRKGAKLHFAGVEGEFVPIGRIAKRGAVNGTTYLFLRRLGDSDPSALYVYDWSQDCIAMPVAIIATTREERDAVKSLNSIVYSANEYIEAGYQPPAEVVEAEKTLGTKEAAKNRNERMSAVLQLLLENSRAIKSLL